MLENTWHEKGVLGLLGWDLEGGESDTQGQGQSHPSPAENQPFLPVLGVLGFGALLKP